MIQSIQMNTHDGKPYSISVQKSYVPSILNEEINKKEKKEYDPCCICFDLNK